MNKNAEAGTSDNGRNDRIPTSIPGLDLALHGGLVRGGMYLVQGHPGSGKTTLALQFLLAGRDRGEATLFVSLSESNADLEQVARTHAWSLDNVALCDLSAQQDNLQQDAQYSIFHPAEIELSETTQAILSQLERTKPSLVVFDGLSEVRLLAREPLRFRRQLLALKHFMAERGITALLLDDRSNPTEGIQPESLVSGNIVLEETTPEYGRSRRRLRITKYRGSDFVGGFHDYDIQQGGVQVYPRLIAADHSHPFEAGKFSCGIGGVDALLSGGLDRGTTSLLIGPAGAGKSTLALQYVSAALARGQKAAYFTFEETLRTLLNRAQTVCRPPLDPANAQERLQVRQVDPAELSPGAFADAVRQCVEQSGVEIVVIDSMNGYLNAMPNEHFLAMHLHELFSYLNQRGVVTIIVSAQNGLLGPMQSPIDVSYLADTVVVLRYYEFRAQVRQAISVFKKRSGPHERTLRDFRMGPNGIEVGEPLTQFQGIFLGVPTQLTESPSIQMGNGFLPDSLSTSNDAGRLENSTA